MHFAQISRQGKAEAAATCRAACTRLWLGCEKIYVPGSASFAAVINALAPQQPQAAAKAAAAPAAVTAIPAQSEAVPFTRTRFQFGCLPACLAAWWHLETFHCIMDALFMACSAFL